MSQDQLLDNPSLFPDPPKRLSNFEVQERATNAQALLHDPTFREALQAIYSEAQGTLVNAEVGSLTATQAHATMKAITGIRDKLSQYMTDHKMRQKYHGGDKSGDSNG